MSRRHPRSSAAARSRAFALLLAVPVLAGCAGPGELVDAARGLAPLPATVDAPVGAVPGSTGAPTGTLGGTEQRAMAVRVPGPRKPQAPSRPRSPQAPEEPGADLAPRFEPPRPTVWPSPGYRHACPQGNDGTSNLPSKLVAGKGALTVTFWNPGAADGVTLTLTARRVTLRVGTQPSPVSVTVPSPLACRDVTATINGLTPGDTYQVWIEQTRRSPIDGRLRTKVVGRTDSIRVG